MLLNKTAVREYILKEWKEQRPFHEITQIDSVVYIALENIIRAKIAAVIDRHPSKGRTFHID